MKNSERRKRGRCATIFLAAILLMAAVGGLVLFSPAGSRVVTGFLLSGLASRDFDYSDFEGILATGIVYKDLEIRGAKFLPAGSVIRAKEISLNIDALSLSGITLKIDQARVRLAESGDVILLNGEVKGAEASFNIFTRQVTLGEFLEVFPVRELRGTQGTLNDVDLWVSGEIYNPHISGVFFIDELRRDGFGIDNVQGRLELTLGSFTRNLTLQGNIYLLGGALFGPRTAEVALEEGRIIFNGDPQDPRVLFRGTSAVERVKINVFLTGSILEPDLRLSSVPAMPQGELLLMLATGRSWGISEEAFSEGRIPFELAQDFLDYFVFAGEGRKLAQKYGITQFWVTFEADQKGVGFSKQVSERVETRFSLEQTTGADQGQQIHSRIGGEVRVTDRIFLEADKELKPDLQSGSEGIKDEEDSKVLLRYKLSF